jgi:sigma-E factor negative regulatory protein RseB
MLVLLVAKMRNVKNCLWAALLGLATSVQAGDAIDWFERMRDALHSENYEGRFVYQVGSQLESMYVVHRISGDVELERLVSLNGPEKQVIRGDRAVACLEPGKHRINVIEGAGGAALAGESSPVQLQRLYDFSLHEGQRAAGRDARLIRVMPRDQLRFGYEIMLDEETALPLHTAMLNSSGEYQSQMMFVELKTGPDIPPIEHDVSALDMAREDRITVAGRVGPFLFRVAFHRSSSGVRVAQLPHGQRSPAFHFFRWPGIPVAVC